MSVPYSDTLKRGFWDSKKGKIAKAAGETGMGEALGTLEKAFAAIPWNEIDAKAPGQQDYTPKVWKDALDAALDACDGQPVVKARLAALDVKHTAELTVKKFSDSKLRLLISKDDTKRADDIGKAAAQLTSLLEPADLKKNVQKRFDDSKILSERFTAAYVDTLKDGLKKASAVLKDIAANPTMEYFNDHIQLAARGVHTQLDKAGSIGRGAVDVAKAKALVALSKEWADGSFKAKSVEETRQEYKKLLKYLQDTNALISGH